MKWKFWKRTEDNKDETIIQVQAHDGGIKEIYVKAQSPEKALDLFKKLKEEST